MKIILFLLTLSSFIIAQDNYQKAKIDMHGGQFDNYNSIGGYKDGNFRKPMDMSMYLDKNSTKTKEKN